MASSTAYELLKACQLPGCPACRVEQDSVERYLNSLLFESVNDVPTRERLRASLGFCREHAQLAVDKNLGNALGFAIIYQDVINNILKQLSGDSTPPATVRLSALLKRVPEQISATVQKVLYALTPHKHCIVCQQRDKTLHIVVSSLLEEIHTPEMKTALQSSEGLCFPHLKKAFEAIPDPAASEFLLTLHRQKLESLHAELTEYIRKNDYRFQAETVGAEGDAWQRAIRKVTGMN